MMGRPLLNNLKTQTKNNIDFHRILELRLYIFFQLVCLLLLYCNSRKSKIDLCVEVHRFWIFFFGTLARLYADK